MGMAKRRQNTPWLCGEDSTAIAPVSLSRKHESCSTIVDSRGARNKKHEVEDKRWKSFFSLPRRGAFKTWVLPNSARKIPTCSAGAAELPGSEQAEGELEKKGKKALKSGEQRDGNSGIYLQRSRRLPEESKNSSFNLGLKAGLLFLYAKAADEVNKMAELRSEMENLLKEIKGTVPETDGISNSGSTAYSHVTWPLEDDQISSEEPHANYPTTGTQMMEQAKEELESELERLQLTLKPFGHQKSPFESEDVGDAGNLSRMDGDDGQKYIANGWNLSCEDGVCPRELEKRLYQLRDVQQREEIQELEEALQSARRSLRAREMEIEWWRERNHLILNTGRKSH